MDNKVIIPKDVAEAIEVYRGKGFSNASIIATACTNVGVGAHAKSLVYYIVGETDSSDKLMSALVNGYTVEQTPEEKVREYYEGHCHRGTYDQYVNGALDGIKGTLDLLGIQIEGVNA
jgi:hypothetical protein